MTSLPFVGGDGSGLSLQAFCHGKPANTWRSLTNLSPELADAHAVPAIQFVALRVFPGCNNMDATGEQGRDAIVWQVMKRENKFPPGAHVTWAWGEQVLHGIVRKVFTHRIERTMKGATVTREASKKNPAYLIQLDDGDDIFLNHNDLRSA